MLRNSVYDQSNYITQYKKRVRKKLLDFLILYNNFFLVFFGYFEQM